jgi:hypothetical protein
LKSTKEQYSFFPKEKYIAIRECKTKILSTVENPLLNPACAPEEHSATSELSSMISVLVFSEYLDLLLGPGPNNEIILIFSTSLFVNVYCCNDICREKHFETPKK